MPKLSLFSWGTFKNDVTCLYNISALINELGKEIKYEACSSIYRFFVVILSLCTQRCNGRHKTFPNMYM